jgi:Na+-driven multidrug efflux pump
MTTQATAQTTQLSILGEIPSLLRLAIPLLAGSASYTFYGLINTTFLRLFGEKQRTQNSWTQTEPPVKL